MNERSQSSVRLSGWALALLLSGCHGAQPDANAALEAEQRGPAWLSGTGATYSFQLKNVAQLAAGNPAAFAFTGELSVTPRAAAKGGVELGLALRNVVPEAEPAQREALLKIAHNMELPLAVRLEGGKIVSLSVAPDADSEAVNVVRVLISALQFAQAAPERASTWTAWEYDSTGKYLAEYQRFAPNRFTKKKQRYEALTFGKDSPGSLGTPLAPSVTSSSETLELASSSFVSAVSDEELSMNLGPGNDASSRTHVELRRVAARPNVGIDWAALDAVAKRYGMNEPLPRAKTDRDAFDRQRIGSFTYETALAQLEKVARDRVEHPDASNDEKVRALQANQQAFNALAGIFRQQPETIAKAEQAVVAGSGAIESLVGALGNADTEASQASLVRLIGETKLPSDIRLSTLRSLVRVQTASDATVAFLQQAADDPQLSAVATFGLGSVCRRLNEVGYRERSARVGQWLIQRLQRASNADEQLRALGGISNSGFEPALPTMSNVLHASDPRVRAAAIEATRLMATKDADGVIAAALNDPVSDVKMAALNASKPRAPAPVLVKGVAAILLGNDRPSVRERAVHIAASWQGAEPELHTALTRLASAERDDGVRSAARTALGVTTNGTSQTRKSDNPG
ncbi:MAG TPA: HEAT repeat domain-containing protein [Polyangiaceae bacterium]|jgi:hypothetical protein|nr:HEAT repeat domain-containing protein [Polyangiaceae bacterium]